MYGFFGFPGGGGGGGGGGRGCNPSNPPPPPPKSAPELLKKSLHMLLENKTGIYIMYTT